MYPEFEWDPVKEKNNLKKHGIRFTQAVTALEDDFAITLEDDYFGERRFITLGQDETGRLIVLVYAYRGERIRIISARKATAAERQVYESERI
jgi:uncharacterized DUF497 family protein